MCVCIHAVITTLTPLRTTLLFANTVILSVDNQGCNILTHEAACVASADGRSEWLHSACHWCCGLACTNNSDHKCEPEVWLFNQESYVGTSHSGDGHDTCPQTSQSALRCMFVNKIINHNSTLIIRSLLQLTWMLLFLSSMTSIIMNGLKLLTSAYIHVLVLT